ncbi:MAG: cyclic nucleotide-binding domain-containing protein [Hyphomicrobiales bacterium]|nr:cyclic nucleotide-binding domain-containing protein [Hyphomicrobiales bacterium]
MNAPVFPGQGVVQSAQETDFRPFARALGMVMDFAPGEFIFREGDAPRCMYLVLKGSIEVSKKGRRVETVHEGETVGTLSLIDGKPRKAAAQAKESCELVVLDKRAVRSMVKQCPNFVWFVLDEFDSQLHATNVLQ